MIGRAGRWGPLRHGVTRVELLGHTVERIGLGALAPGAIALASHGVAVRVPIQRRGSRPQHLRRSNVVEG